MGEVTSGLYSFTEIQSNNIVSRSKIETKHKNEYINKLFIEKLTIIQKIFSKENTARKINFLNNKINEINEEINNLENGTAKNSLCAALTKKTCQKKLKKLQVIRDEFEQQVCFLRSKLPTHEEERLATVFDIEYQLRMALEGDFPNKEKYQDLYDRCVLPLVKDAKRSISEKPFQFIVQAAAAKGKGVLAGLGALNNLASKKPMIENSGVSVQEVFLLPQEGVVYKRSNERAKEEEEIINALFDLMSKNAVVGSFDIQNPSLERFGMNLPEDLKKRGFTRNSLSPSLLNRIREKLSTADCLILDNDEKKAVSKVYLAPDLKSPDEIEAYERCEKLKWVYKDRDGASREVDFKTLHAHIFAGEYVEGVEFIFNKIDAVPSNDQIKLALNPPWKIISPEIMQLSYRNFIGVQIPSVSEISQIQAKPFVNQMILLQDLSYNARDAALKRLTEDSQFNAILTAEFQLLDLHPQNLGIEPVPNSKYDHYANLQFRLQQSNESQSFKNLLIYYLEGEIGPDTFFEFEDEGRIICQQLKDLPKLQEALNVQWKLVIFDTDQSLSEDNLLQVKLHNGYPSYNIPLRSVLLESKWKNHPLNDEVIQRFMNSEQSDLRVKQWISKADAPIYKHLSDEVKKDIQQQIARDIEKFSLSAQRKDGEQVTIKILTNDFADKISNIKYISYLKIWKTLEQDLSFVSVRSNDTWETIARRYHQDAATLQSLNPQGIQEGKKIKIEYDLTSSSPEAANKRKKIAKQLYPRLTFRQQAALLERQQNRKTYLRNHQNLSESTLKGKKLAAQIEKYLKEPTTPLSTRRRKELLTQLIQQKSHLFNQVGLSDLKTAICKECEPTYFNLTKALYPLLADTYELNQLVYGEAEAGASIGYSDRSIGVTIFRAQNNFPPNSTEDTLSKNLQTKLSSIVNSHFLAYN